MLNKVGADLLFVQQRTEFIVLKTCGIRSVRRVELLKYEHFFRNISHKFDFSRV